MRLSRFLDGSEKCVRTSAGRDTMTMTMTHSEKSHIGQMRARVSGPWPHKKESVLQVKLALLARCKNKLLWTECSAQRRTQSSRKKKKTRNLTGCCCAEFTINSRNLQIRSNTHKRTRSTGSQEAPGETRKPGRKPRRNAVRPRAAIVPAA